MECVGNFYRCRDCGATFNKLPSLGQSPLDEHSDYIMMSMGGTMFRAGRPSKALKLSTKRDRRLKGVD